VVEKVDVMLGPDDILQFWFADATQAPAKAEARMSLWFQGSPEGDARIRDRFGQAVEAAIRGELASWVEAPHPALALVVLLDQFSRNMWRGMVRAFAQDAQALGIASRAVAADFLWQLAPIERPFLTLPFQHSESLEAQRASVHLCREIAATAPLVWRPLLETFTPYADQHLAIIERFGRFPHRNAVLGRVSTPEERAYLNGGGQTFGQG
jgi:uncharacterized protein (DUF924 family)